MDGGRRDVVNHGFTKNMCVEEILEALGKMKCGKAVGADKISVEAWTRKGEFGLHLLCILLNSVLTTENMPSEWIRRYSIFKGKENIGECKYNSVFKLLAHIISLWERVVNTSLGECTSTQESQFERIPCQSRRHLWIEKNC